MRKRNKPPICRKQRRIELWMADFLRGGLAEAGLHPAYVLSLLHLAHRLGL
jgi:hypothetical protein